MNDIEQLIGIMREQGAVNNSPTLTIGVMTGATSCKVGELNLSREDLYIAEHLLNRVCKKVAMDSKTTTTTTTTTTVSGTDESGHKAKSNSSSNSTTTNTDKSEYLEPLKSGDIVLVYPYSDSKYIIIEKLI